MKLNRVGSAKEFLDLLGDRLLSDEVRYSLLYGIAERVLLDKSSFGPIDPWFLTITGNDTIYAAAMRTPPHGAILAHFEGDIDANAQMLTEAIHSFNPLLPGIIGDKAIATAFTRYWYTSYNNELTREIAQRIYKLTNLTMPKMSPGNIRKANLFEKDLVMLWTEAFQRETIGGEVSPNHEKICLERIQNGDIFIWIDDIPKSIAAKVRPSRNGISIGGVYTPPEFRCMGYASSCVSSLCKQLLSDYSFCMLYTDLSNPISNSIYKRMGFEEYCDSVQCIYSINRKT